MKISAMLLVLLTIACCVLGVLYYKSCNDPIDPLIDELKADIETRDEQLKMKDEALEEIKKEHDKKIAELNGVIDSANTIITNLEEKDKETSGELSELEEKFENLEDKDEKISNLQGQLTLWKARLDLSSQKLKKKDTIIFSLQKKFDEEHTLYLAQELVVIDYKKSIATRDELIAALNQKLRHRSRSRWLERAGFVTLSGILLYSHLR